MLIVSTCVLWIAYQVLALVGALLFHGPSSRRDYGRDDGRDPDPDPGLLGAVEWLGERVLDPPALTPTPTRSPTLT